MCVDSGLDSMIVYDLVTEAWSTAPVMPSIRYYHSSIALGGKLYITAGGDSDWGG